MCHGQILSEAIRKARKQHSCSECGRPINVGENYYNQTAVVDGDFQYSCTHTRCEAIAELVVDEGGDACTYSGESRELLKEISRDTHWSWKDIKREVAAKVAALKKRLT